MLEGFGTDAVFGVDAGVGGVPVGRDWGLLREREVGLTLGDEVGFGLGLFGSGHFGGCVFGVVCLMLVLQA